ncbi:MAG: hypothetical protein AAGA70_10470 [Pseudomonadota bacterium]
METHIQNFFVADNGSATVDWVVLAAALVGLGLTAATVISTGLDTLSNEIADELEETNPGELPFSLTGSGPTP